MMEVALITAHQGANYEYCVQYSSGETTFLPVFCKVSFESLTLLMIYLSTLSIWLGVFGLGFGSKLKFYLWVWSPLPLGSWINHVQHLYVDRSSSLYFTRERVLFHVFQPHSCDWNITGLTQTCRWCLIIFRMENTKGYHQKSVVFCRQAFLFQPNICYIHAWLTYSLIYTLVAVFSLVFPRILHCEREVSYRRFRYCAK